MYSPAENRSEKSSSTDENATANRKIGNPDVIDILVANSTFPDAAGIFSWQSRTLHEVIETACVVLDTNALLVPYGIGPGTLSKIEETYQKLITEGRLRIPAQVAREFAKHRVSRLADIYSRLSQKRSTLRNLHQGNYPMLENLDVYSTLQDFEHRIDVLTADYKHALSAVLERIR